MGERHHFFPLLPAAPPLLPPSTLPASICQAGSTWTSSGENFGKALADQSARSITGRLRLIAKALAKRV